MGLKEYFEKKNELKAEINKLYIKQNDVEIPLFFHGTDAKVLRMTEQERDELKNACLVVIDCLWNFFKDHLINNLIEYREQLGEELWRNLNTACTCNRARLENNQQYQYGNLYLTNNPLRAISYALSSNVYGELGNIAKRFYEAALVLKFDFSKMSIDNQKYFDLFRKVIAEKPEPVVCALPNINLDLVQNDKGAEFDWSVDFDTIFGMDGIGSFRYIGAYDLKNSIIIPLKSFESKLEKLGYAVDSYDSEHVVKIDNEKYEAFVKNRDIIIENLMNAYKM